LVSGGHGWSSSSSNSNSNSENNNARRHGRNAIVNANANFNAFVTVVVLVLLVVFPSGVNGTVFLPEFNRSYTSLPGLFGGPLDLSKNDPPVSAYLTLVSNQPYMCPDELKNIQPHPPPPNLLSNNYSNNYSNNSNSNGDYNNNNKTDYDYDYDYDSDNSMIQPLPKPADGLPIALLVERGMCTFWEKAEMASRYGPAVRYVIIFDDIVSPDLVPMSSEYNTDMTLLFVSSQSGYELRNFIVRNQPFLNHRFETPPSSPTVPNGDSNNNNSDSNSNSNNDISINGNNYKDDDNIYNDNDNVDYEEEDGGSVNVHGNTEAYGDHTNGILVLIDGERPYIDPAFPALNMAAYFLAAMSGFLAFLIFFGCLLVCAQCGCITAAPDENGRIVLFAGGPGIRHTEGLARMIRVHKLTAEQVRTLDEEEFSTSESGEEGGGESNGDSCCCCICLEEFEHKEKVRVLPCGHKFHEDCLIPWLTERDASCPLCKMDVLEHVLETEKKNGTKDGEGSEVDKERQASDTEAFGNETNTNTNSGTADSNDDGDNNNNNNTNSNLQASRGTSPVRSVWYRLRGWSLIADTAPSDHQGETTTLQGTRGGARRSLEVLSEIEMEDRTTAPLSTVNSNAENVI